MRIILASQSPRRLEILKKHGIDPVVMPVDVDETLPEGIDAKDAVMFLALKKALACEQILLKRGDFDDTVILTADTVVYKDGLGIMGKPKDHDDAVRMLRAIRGTVHQVATGICVLVPGKKNMRVACDITDVYCKLYTDEDIEEYITNEPPYDKAGSYAIQSSFGQHIDHIIGDYENVVGLPYYRVEEELGYL